MLFMWFGVETTGNELLVYSAKWKIKSTTKLLQNVWQHQIRYKHKSISKYCDFAVQFISIKNKKTNKSWKCKFPFYHWFYIPWSVDGVSSQISITNQTSMFVVHVAELYQ